MKAKPHTTTVEISADYITVVDQFSTRVHYYKVPRCAYWADTLHNARSEQEYANIVARLRRAARSSNDSTHARHAFHYVERH